MRAVRGFLCLALAAWMLVGCIDSKPLIEALDACSGDSCGNDLCGDAIACVDGACEPGALSCSSLANSVDDFSETQGTAGWRYGFWDDDGSEYTASDFQEMSLCAGVWRAACVERGEEGFWTLLLNDRQHSETRPVRRLSVRRWTSSAAGRAELRVVHGRGDPSAVHNTLGTVLVDGVVQWSNESTSTSERRVEARIPVDLAEGTHVDLMLDPLEAQDADMTVFTLEVVPR
ncbi:MAG: hypothetical protein AAF938_02740 [Myxococcota bacterium]